MLHNRTDHHFIDGLFRMVVYCSLHISYGRIFRLALDSPPSSRLEVLLLFRHILLVKTASNTNFFHKGRKKVPIRIQRTHNFNLSSIFIFTIFN